MPNAESPEALLKNLNADGIELLRAGVQGRNVERIVRTRAREPFKSAEEAVRRLEEDLYYRVYRRASALGIVKNVRVKVGDRVLAETPRRVRGHAIRMASQAEVPQLATWLREALKGPWVGRGRPERIAKAIYEIFHSRLLDDLAELVAIRRFSPRAVVAFADHLYRLAQKELDQLDSS